MKKSFKVVMLPTEKSIGVYEKCLWLSKLGKDLHYELAGYAEHKIEGVKKQHLYIISDEEIKEGDWVTDDIIKPFQLTRSHIELLEGTEEKDTCKKVIATTDKSIVYPVNSFPWMPEVPESFIQAYVKAYNEGNPIIEVELEIEEHYEHEEISYEGDSQSVKYTEIKTNPDNTVIIHL